jgi:hypothetical protein
VTISEATETEDGFKKATCKNCGAIKGDIIPALNKQDSSSSSNDSSVIEPPCEMPPSETNSSSSNEQTTAPTMPFTGCQATLTMPISTMLLMLGGGYYLKKRRK